VQQPCRVVSKCSGRTRRTWRRCSRQGEAIRRGEPEEEATSSDKEMQEEIREAQAAVDECYWRWAEHAGIKVKFPRNRLMTEEELDGLSEQLGDGIGARAKRRREIERMSIVEMKARLKRSRRRLRGGGAGRQADCHW
jgi:hypothetical protein